jgi:hypothetical protein
MIAEVPPKGRTRYFRDIVSQPFGADYVVRVRQLDGDLDTYQLLLGVMTEVTSDCEDDDINPYELLERAISIPIKRLEG